MIEVTHHSLLNTNQERIRNRISYAGIDHTLALRKTSSASTNERESLMPQEWFVRRGDVERGPLTPQEVKDLVAKGILVPSDFVRTSDKPEWRQAGSVKGLFASKTSSKSLPPPLPNPSPPNSPQPRHSTPTNPSSLVKQRPFWQRKRIAVLLTIFCWPVGMLLVWFHPRLSRRSKMIWTGTSLVGFLVLSIIVPKSKNHISDAGSSANQVASATDPTVERKEANPITPAKSSTPVDPTMPTEKVDFSLPSEFTQQKPWPDLPLTKMPVQLRQGKSQGSNSHVFFSPKGTFVADVLESHPKYDLRLWNTATGEEQIAKSSECDYFSLPASFSPDESRLVCLDGDFLRIWNLKTSPATLVQTLRLSAPNQQDKWNALLWGADDTLIVSVRPEYHNISTYQRLRQKATGFSPDGPIRSSPQKYNAERVRSSSVAVSPDGNIAAIAVIDGRSGAFVIQVTEYESEKLIKEIPLPTGAAPEFEHFPTAALREKIETNHSYFSDKGSCIEFSPDGRFLLVAAGREIKVISTATWHKGVNLDLGGLSSTTEDRYMPRCFSKDGNSIAGIAIRSQNTSRGNQSTRVAVVHDLLTGKRTTEIDLGTDFGVGNEGKYYRMDHEKVAFNTNGQSLVVAVSRDMGWNNKNKRAEGAWAVGSWSLKDGKKQSTISGVVQNTPAVQISPNAEIAVLSRFDSLQVLDVAHLAKLRIDLDEGDRLWEEGNHAEALKLYCSAANDGMTSQVYSNLTQVWSRCVDAFAERGEVAKSKSVAFHLQQMHMQLEPETAQGKKVVENLLAEQAEAKRQSVMIAKEAETKRLTELRAKNRRNHVMAALISKREFIEKLRATAIRGRIDNSVTYAIFEDFSFQDVFGDPDSNLEWTNRERLYLYRCKDGAVQLTIRIIDSRVFLSGFNEY